MFIRNIVIMYLLTFIILLMILIHRVEMDQVAYIDQCFLTLAPSLLDLCLCLH